MTDREIKNAEKMLPPMTRVPFAEWTEEQKQLDSELSCRDMINSILCYDGAKGLKGNRYLQSYIDELGEATVTRLCKEQIEDFRKAVVLKNVHIDNEGVSYNSVIWADEMLEEIEKLAKTELNENGSIGYTLPDRKYHIYIYVDDSIKYADDSKTIEDGYYVIEPNKVVDGAHEPLGDTHVAEYNDFDELLKGCKWCLEKFANDREEQVKGAVVEKIISDASVKSAETGKGDVKADVELGKD